MKNILSLNRPVAVVQCFWHRFAVRKPLWRDGAWRSLAAWPREIDSNSGWIDDGTLILNESVLERKAELETADIVIVQDTISYQTRQPYPSRSPHPYPVFRHEFERPDVIRLVSETTWFALLTTNDRIATCDRYALGWQTDELSLFLNSGSDSEPYRVAKLTPNSPVRITANDKHDSTDSFHRDDRHYYVFDDIFVYLGDVHEIEVRPWSAMTHRKNVPLESARVVDLQKELY
jgi:hypothetical protein